MRKGIPNPFGLLRLAAIVREEQVEILNGHLVQASLMARLVRMFVHVPVVISSMHSHKLVGVVGKNGSFSWRDVSHRMTDSMADITTTISHASAKRLVSHGIVSRERVRVLPNGVDLASFFRVEGARERVRASLGIGEDDFVFLAAGRIEAAKDYPTLLKSLARMERKPTLIICGTGSLADQLKYCAAELHIERNVRFLGLRRDVPNLMSAADAFVMSSVLEGLPMVLLEAGAAQLPTIATTVGGNAEVVVEGETGFLIPPSNTERLAGAMVAMMALGEGRRRRMGANAYRRVADSFSIEHSVDSWEELYINTLQSVENCSSRSRGSICAAKS